MKSLHYFCHTVALDTGICNFENHSIILMSEDERRKEIPDFRAYSPLLNDYSVGAMLEDPYANLIGDMTRNFLNKTISKEITSASRREDLDDSFKNGDIYHGKDGKDSYFFLVKIREVRALLDTKWHQWHPFNAWCPERRKTLGFRPQTESSCRLCGYCRCSGLCLS